MLKRITLMFFCGFIVLSGCGGGGSSSGSSNAPQLVSSTPADGSWIASGEPLLFLFDRSLDVASISLSGNLAAESDGGVLSTTTEPDDTLTISPTSVWSGGEGRTLSVEVASLAGGTTMVDSTFSLGLVLGNFQAATVALGPDNLTSVGSAMNTASSQNQPWGTPVYAGGRLYTTNYNGNRVVIHNGIPSASGMSADSVLGQLNLLANAGGVITAASTLYLPLDVAANSDQLAVVDGDNRVLIYPSIPATGPTNASVALGQQSTVSSTSGCLANALDTPYSVSMTDNMVVVADYGNNRVLIWNSIPTVSGQLADLVLGQGSMTHCAQNDDAQTGAAGAGPTDRTLNAPTGVWTDGDKLFVLDGGNNRVLIWDTFPVANFERADRVLGQQDFVSGTANDPALSAATLNANEGAIGSNGQQICVSDNSNNRVLIWDTWQVSDGQAADAVLGQMDFDIGESNDSDGNGVAGPSISASTLSNPGGCSFVEDKLLVSDSANNRVIVYESQ